MGVGWGERGREESAPKETSHLSLWILPRWGQRTPRASQPLLSSHKQVACSSLIKLKFFVILEAILLKNMEMPADTRLN